MRRNALTRITTVLYAVWLVVALGVQTAQPCPTHDGASLAASHAAMAGTAMQRPMAESGGAHAHGSHPASPHDTMHHACTCVGCCCVTGIDFGSAHTVRVPVSRIVAAVAATPAAACPAPASRAVRLLPFANGPPVVSSITA